MSFRHSSAVTTLKGKSLWWVRKCLFSVIITSAPTHSVYAAMKASADLRPLASYLMAISKGTTMSSSIVVIALMNLTNSWKASADKFRLTSSNIVRGMRMLCRYPFSSSLSRNSHEGASFNDPKANMYSLESMTKRNLLFFLPDFLSCFPQGFYNIIFAHFKNRGRIFGNYFSNFNQMVFGLFRIFHCLSPHFKDYYGVKKLSIAMSKSDE